MISEPSVKPTESRKWEIASSLAAMSVETSAGRLMTVAPSEVATAAISELSVLTKIGQSHWVARLARIDRATNDTPPTVCRFLRGIPLEPPRAGIRTTTLSLVIGRATFQRQAGALPLSESLIRKRSFCHHPKMLPRCGCPARVSEVHPVRRLRHDRCPTWRGRV